MSLAAAGTPMAVVPERWARYYLENAPSLVWLLVANVAAVLVGVRFYLDNPYGPGLAEVDTFLWPLYADSPAAVFLMTLSLATLLPNLGRPLPAAPGNRTLAYLHTFAFVWLVKYGLWTVVALNLGFDVYFPDLWAYWGIVLTHLGFVVEAFLVPHYGRTSRGALAAALVVLIAADGFDYLLGYHPPLRYEPGVALPVATVLLSVSAVVLADRVLDRTA